MTTVVTEGTPIRILLAENHSPVRSTIEALLADREDLLVVAEARDGDEALMLADSRAPDVALIDFELPGGVDSLEVMRSLATSPRHIPTIILSEFGADDWILRALQNGAVGFVLRTVQPEELHMAIRAAARGDNFLCPSIARQVIDNYLEHAHAQDDQRHRLTGRQRQILELVAEGNTTKEIARRLRIAVKTVEAHRGEIMRRLDVHNLAGLVQQAVRMGLLTLQGPPGTPD